MSYQRQAKEMAERIQDLETQLAEAHTEVFGVVLAPFFLYPFFLNPSSLIPDPSPSILEVLTTTEKSKYKQLARRLKEERNTAKEQLAKKTGEQQEVKKCRELHTTTF